MNARRYPRTMAEAFGPYTDNKLEPMKRERPGPRWEWWLYAAAIVASVAFFLIRGH